VKRLDWRFLLPDAPDGGPFRHLVLLGANERLLDEVVARGIAQQVSTAYDKPRSADAVVILMGAADSAARQALGCLTPGGTVYWETRRVASAKRTLRARGVRLTGDYWVLPSFEQARVYLPLDRPEATRWYLASMFRATTPRERLVEPALHMAARFASPMLAWAAQHHALTGVVGRPGRLGLLADDGQRPIMLTLGHAGRRVALLPFAAGGRRPLSVLKLSRDPSLNAAAEREQGALRTLRASLDPLMRATIPEPMGTFGWRDLTVAVESCAEGRLLSTSTQRWGVPLARHIDDLRTVAAWQARLHTDAVMERTLWSEALVQEWIDGPLARYELRFGVTPAEDRLFGVLRARGRDLLGLPIPLVWTHWGLRDQNIFRLRRGLVVVDWEDGGPGLPGLDLMYFVTAWSHAVRRLRGPAAELRGVHDLYCETAPGDSACAAARQVVREYLVRVGLDPRFLPVLLVVMWVFRALGQSAEMPRAANRYTEYLGVLAAHTDRLFGTSAVRAPNQ
jgi:Phosphotransferase enzyme family